MSDKSHPEEESEGAEGGHAAERLDEFLSKRFPGGLPPEESPVDEPPDDCDPPANEEATNDESVTDESA